MLRVDMLSGHVTAIGADMMGITWRRAGSSLELVVYTYRVNNFISGLASVSVRFFFSFFFSLSAPARFQVDSCSVGLLRW